MNVKLKHEQQTNQYDKGYKWLHWLMAILVILMFMATFGFAQATTDNAKIEMLMGHSSIGSLIFILFSLRFTKRFIMKSSRPHHELDAVTEKTAKIGHLTLYLLHFFVPVTGYLSARVHELPVYWFGQINLATASGDNQASFDILHSFHELGVQTLMVLVVLHIGAAIFHGLIKKDGVFSAMWPGKNKT
jgi:cytochrome b561